MFVLGYNASHDPCACLLEDGQIRAAIAVERLARVLSAHVPRGATVQEQDRLRASGQDAIQYCCDIAKISPSQIDYVALASSDSSGAEDLERRTLATLGTGFRGRFVHLPHPEHHLAHAYSAFFTSGFSSAAALVADCYGSFTHLGDPPRRQAESGYVFETPDRLPRSVFSHQKGGAVQGLVTSTGDWWLPRPCGPDGLGELYRCVTLLLGFHRAGSSADDAGKTMGLAPYGRRLSKEPVFLQLRPNGELDFSAALPFLEGRNLVVERNGERYLSARAPQTPLSQFHKDLAAQVQWELELGLVHIAKHLRRQTGMRRLVMAGGVFLNAVANRRILAEAGFAEVFPFPAASDDGTAVGAAYYAFQHARRARRLPVRTPRITHVGYGKTYSDGEIEQELGRWRLAFEDCGSREAAARRTGALLAKGAIVGWHQGGAELGPRALGHRSILADPRNPDIRDILNARIKFREGFRPFAPAVIASEAARYFEVGDGHESPFMLLIYPVRKRYRRQLPGITHVDGTARVQTVRAEDNPLFHEVIRSYGEKTGLPIVVNTSFNLRGMPMVESPADSVSCFLQTDLDYLVIGRYLVPLPDRARWRVERQRAVAVGLQGQLGTDRFELSTSVAGRSLSTVEERLLAAVDGKRSIEQVAARAKVPAKQGQAIVLGFVRAGWCRWAGRPRRTG